MSKGGERIPTRRSSRTGAAVKQERIPTRQSSRTGAAVKQQNNVAPGLDSEVSSRTLHLDWIVKLAADAQVAVHSEALTDKGVYKRLSGEGVYKGAKK